MKFSITILVYNLFLISHTLQTLQKNYFAEPKSCMKKPRRTSYIEYERYYDTKTKASTLKEKNYCFLLKQKADQQGSKLPFRNLHWIAPYLVEKILPNNSYIVRKLNTNTTRNLHRFRLRSYNPEKPPDDNYWEAQWQIADNIVTRQDDLCTLEWEAEFGGHLFDKSIFYANLNAVVLVEFYTHGPSYVIVPRSDFHEPSDVQNRETCSSFDPSFVYPSIPNLHGQSQNVKTTTDVKYNDRSTRAPESDTILETAYEPMQQPPLRWNGNPSTLESIDPTTEIILQNEPSHSRGGKYNLNANPNPNYSEIYRY